MKTLKPLLKRKEDKNNLSVYEKLLDEATSNNVEIYEKEMTYTIKGLYADNSILLNSRLNHIEKICILTEELGHHYTSFGDILDQSKLENRKQEKRARNWAYERMIPLDKFIEAYQAGVTNRYEFAELIGVTEDFLTESIKHYQQKYGLCTTHNGYIIYFENVGVVKSFE